MKYMRRKVGYTWTDYKTNVQIAKELNITQILDKLLEYKRSWIQHINRMPRNRLPRVMKHYCPTGRWNHCRLLKRLLDTWDRNGSTSGPTPWKIYDDDDDEDDDDDDDDTHWRLKSKLWRLPGLAMVSVGTGSAVPSTPLSHIAVLQGHPQITCSLNKHIVNISNS